MRGSVYALGPPLQVPLTVSDGPKGRSEEVGGRGTERGTGTEKVGVAYTAVVLLLNILTLFKILHNLPPLPPSTTSLHYLPPLPLPLPPPQPEDPLRGSQGTFFPLLLRNTL